MNSAAKFDVIIAYNGAIAMSASSRALTPFPHSPSYGDSYGYFLQSCASLGIKSSLSTSKDIIGAGKFAAYWSFENSTWIKHCSPATSKLIFDKFSPTTQAGKQIRNLLFSSKTVRPYNSPMLFELFFDKLATHNRLTDASIPTVPISINSVTPAIKQLSSLITKHRNSQDFNSTLILKDRFGAGGHNIYKFARSNILGITRTLRAQPQISFILQPYTPFDSNDVRLIYLSNKLISSYVRTAKIGDYRCNQHQGATLQYLKLSSIPKKITQIAQKTISLIDSPTSLYTLDFILTPSGHPYLLEGNTGPGLTWDLSDQTDIMETKKLIRKICFSIKSRLHKINPKLSEIQVLPYSISYNYSLVSP